MWIARPFLLAVLAMSMTLPLAGWAPANEGNGHEGPGNREHDGFRDRPRHAPEGPDPLREKGERPGPYRPHPKRPLQRPPGDDDFHPGPAREGQFRPGADRMRPEAGPPRMQEDHPMRGHEWEMMEDRDPEMFRLMQADHDLERRTMELVEQYRRAPEEPRDDIRAEIIGVVNRHYEVRQERRELELRRLEEELERMRTSIERRREARDEIIERYIRRLLGEDELAF